jgi:predicted permease
MFHPHPLPCMISCRAAGYPERKCVSMVDLSPQLLLVGKLFVLMGIGFLLRKKAVIPEEGKNLLTDLIIDLILPCSIISSFLIELTDALIRQTAVIFLLSVAIQAISYLTALFAYRFCMESHQTVLKYGTVCSNSGILGTPIAEGIFGTEGTALAAVYLIPLRVVMWTLGLSFFTKPTGKFPLRRILTHPCIAAVLIGLVLMITQVKIPTLARSVLTSVAGCNTAFSMILVGSIIADMDVRLILHLDTLYFSAIRLAALPLLVLVVCNLCGIDTLVRNLSVILTAMPAGATTSILALKYHGDASFASACTALTTVLSLVAVPLWCSFLL